MTKLRRDEDRLRVITHRKTHTFMCGCWLLDDECLSPIHIRSIDMQGNYCGTLHKILSETTWKANLKGILLTGTRRVGCVVMRRKRRVGLLQHPQQLYALQLWLCVSSGEGASVNSGATNQSHFPSLENVFLNGRGVKLFSTDI